MITDPTLDVFRFLHIPTKPFLYLEAMWLLELLDCGDHWEYLTTAPTRLILMFAETEAALRHELTVVGVAVVRKSKTWFLLEHLVGLGWTEMIGQAR